MELVFAYIDPGSGSLIVQALVAGLVAIPVIFRQQIRRIVGVMRGQSEPGTDAATSQDDVSNGV